MANNVFPLRMGEVVRAWYLSRETGVSVAAVFGTVILERVIDTLMVVVLAAGVVGTWGAGRRRLLRARGAAAAPARRAALRGSGAASLRPGALPARRRDRAASPPRTDFGEAPRTACGASRRGSARCAAGVHLLWILLHSLAIWLVASTLPMIAGFRSLGIDFGSLREEIAAAWATLAAIGIAVAIPSAPGFFGPFHYAARIALQRFGVAPETAVAFGTVIHAVMWVTLTGLGLLVLRLRRTSLEEVDQATVGSWRSRPSVATPER